MGYAVYSIGNGRFGGYGVPAYCEHPGCKKVIDRGMSYACGGEPFSEIGCDKYFCTKHRHYAGFKIDGDGGRCDHDDDCECDFKDVCKACADGTDSFPYKPEHPRWIRHVLKDESWKQWREKYPFYVEDYKKQLENYKLNKKTYGK